MNISRQYSEVIAIEFTLTCGDVLQMLRAAGHAPKDFVLDCDNPEATDWPIKLHLKREVKKEQPDTTAGGRDG